VGRGGGHELGEGRVAGGTDGSRNRDSGRELEAARRGVTWGSSVTVGEGQSVLLLISFVRA
jgi:hypothetical protein